MTAMQGWHSRWVLNLVCAGCVMHAYADRHMAHITCICGEMSAPNTFWQHDTDDLSHMDGLIPTHRVAFSQHFQVQLHALQTPSCRARVLVEPLCCACALQVGAKLVPVQLQPPNWSIPEDQLRAAFSDKTKFILVNTPHNPTGKVGIGIDENAMLSLLWSVLSSACGQT
jgi:hypothetical protein